MNIDEPRYPRRKVSVASAVMMVHDSLVRQQKAFLQNKTMAALF